eukprot:Platyproteum_vivax@DN2420_c0_g1_i1.p1
MKGIVWQGCVGFNGVKRLCHRPQAFTRSLHTSSPRHRRIMTGENVEREISQTELLCDMLRNSHQANGRKSYGDAQLFEILSRARNPTDMRACFWAINFFFNYGKRTMHPELPTKIAAMLVTTNSLNQAFLFTNDYKTWMRTPPCTATSYAIMNQHIEEGLVLKAREMVSKMRTNWQVDLNSVTYSKGLEAMLKAPKDPLEEAHLVYDDAKNLNCTLTPYNHCLLLEPTLHALEAAISAAGDKWGKDPQVRKEMSRVKKIDKKLVEDMRLNKRYLGSRLWALLAWARLRQEQATKRKTNWRQLFIRAAKDTNCSMKGTDVGNNIPPRLYKILKESGKLDKDLDVVGEDRVSYATANLLQLEAKKH